MCRSSALKHNFSGELSRTWLVKIVSSYWFMMNHHIMKKIKVALLLSLEDHKMQG